MENIAFFTNFLKISQGITLVSIFVLLGSLYFLKVLQKKKVSFSTRMLIALVLGLVLGLGIDLFGSTQGVHYTQFAQKEITVWFSLLGSGVLKLIQLLAVPIVFLSIVDIVTQVNGENIKSLSIKAFTMLLGTTAISALVAVGVVELLQLSASGFAGELTKSTADRMQTIASQSFPQFFLDLIPNNIFSVMTTNSQIVSVVIVGTLVAGAIRFLNQKNPEVIQPAVSVLMALKEIVNSMLKTVLKWMPYGIVALVSSTIIRNGVSVISSTFSFIVGLYIAVFIMLGVYAIILAVNGLNPITFYKKAFSTMVFAFSSRSSVGTLPYTLNTLEEQMGVSKQNARFIATLGTTIGMNGCAGVFPAMLGVLLAKATGQTLDVSFIVTLILVVTIGSVGIAGVPGTATVAATVTLNGLGLGSYMNQIGAVFGIDPIVDMGRTMLNVTGALLSSVIVDKWENKIDLETYHK
ncbi:cation:dicarboxylase symporter family transporter [Granulicatella sp. zg-ZJ]|uniref:cation:dicarboxylate symporter family transporter n=1 Tax=Granulicatella sp. zg-ZJ TaxID=2678504 RepID=UPI0013D3B67D|nr:cation:dicarboxylase symporter family transporter [Granulicatella sp. zg-ZJ]NEW62746.1 cation:dicarboxylase symporter family transporter [Granulicatella sp. zg-ZJ]